MECVVVFYHVLRLICVCQLKGSGLNAFRDGASRTQGVAGPNPRDPEGKAPIDGWKTPTVLCFLCAQSPLSLQLLWAHTLIWKQHWQFSLHPSQMTSSVLCLKLKSCELFYPFPLKHQNKANIMSVNYLILREPP